MDHYVLEKSTTDTAMQAATVPSDPRELVIKTHGKVKHYVGYGMTQVQKSGEVFIVGTGRAVTMAVTVAEIVKRRIGGLHQRNTVGFETTTDTWKPRDDTPAATGLDTLEAVRKVPSIRIVLSQAPLDPTLPGYQRPEKQSV